MSKRHSKAPRKESAIEHGEPSSRPANSTNMQKLFLAVAIFCEIGWIVFLVVLAITK
jgi:hypothetical protein